MIELKKSDIRMLSHIKEKKNKMDYMQMVTSDDEENNVECNTELGYVFMEQIDTLNQLKAIECSICNDHQQTTNRRDKEKNAHQNLLYLTPAAISLAILSSSTGCMEESAANIPFGLHFLPLSRKTHSPYP